MAVAFLLNPPSKKRFVESAVKEAAQEKEKSRGKDS
jgi:hypothetical protein